MNLTYTVRYVDRDGREVCSVSGPNWPEAKELAADALVRYMHENKNHHGPFQVRVGMSERPYVASKKTEAAKASLKTIEITGRANAKT